MTQNKRLYLLGSLSLLGLALVAWAPLLRDYLPVDNDIFGIESLPQHGIWRVLGRLAVLWTVSLPGALPGVIAVAAHVLACLLLFAACWFVWGDFRVSLLIAIAYCVYPWGYGLMTTGWGWLLAIEVCFLWCVTIWIVTKCRNPQGCHWFELPLVAVVVLVALATQERLSFCYPMLSAWALWVLWNKRRELGTGWGKASVVVMAPVVGFAVYTVLYVLTKESDINAPGFHIPALLSTFVKQFRHYHHFVPLFSPGVWPTFVFYEWSAHQLLIIIFGGLVGVAALFFVGRAASEDRHSTPAKDLRWLHKVGLAVALLAGPAMIFVVAGGYSDEIYKRYPLGSLLAFSLCGFLSLVPAASRVLFSAPGKAALVGLAAIFIFTDWLHAGVWRYEVRSLHKLVDLIQRESLPVPATIEWAHEPRAFWPQLNTITEAMRTGELLIGDVRELYMEKFKVKPPDVSPAASAFYTEDEEWVFELGNR